MRRVLLLLSASVLLGCSALDPVASAVHSATGKVGAGAEAGSGCRDTFVSSLESATPVHGAFACLNAQLQTTAGAGGITNDKGLADNASMPPVYTGIHLLGRGPARAYEYQMLVDGAPAFLFVWVDPDGKVSAVRVLPS